MATKPLYGRSDLSMTWGAGALPLWVLPTPTLQSVLPK